MIFHHDINGDFSETQNTYSNTDSLVIYHFYEPINDEKDCVKTITFEMSVNQ